MFTRLTTADLAEQAEPRTPVFRCENQTTTTSATRVTGKPPSDRALAYLRTLLAEREGVTEAEEVRALLNATQEAGGLNSRVVSAAIDSLKAIPRVRSTDPAPRTNRYPGRCEECGTRVEAEQGLLVKTDGGWEVSHREGQCPVNEFPFPYGRYAVEGEDGTLKFYAATHDGLFVQASDDLHAVPGPAQKAIIAKIAADPEAASRAYGREFKTCGRCGRGLTDEHSRAAGIGPVCQGKAWN